MDFHQSDNYEKFIESLGWIVEKSGKTNFFIKKIGPTSLIKIQRPEKLDISDIDRIVRKYRPLLTKIEPDVSPDKSVTSVLSDMSALSDNWPLLPTKTIILDLESISLESLPKDTRYEIRKATEHSLSLSLNNDVDLFYHLLEETMKIGDWSVPIKKEVTNLFSSFQPNSSALLFVHESSQSTAENVHRINDGSTVNREPDSTVNSPIAACLLIWDGDTAHYMYAALTQKGRELGAAYFLLWKTIEFCQKLGLKKLDLQGIYDDRFPSQNKKWKGFTKFKMGWNGKVLEYPGSWTKYNNLLIKWLFKLAI